MKKRKSPCIFCKGFKLRRFDLVLIVLMCLAIYWVNQYKMHQIDLAQQQEEATRQKDLMGGE